MPSLLALIAPGLALALAGCGSGERTGRATPVHTTAPASTATAPNDRTAGTLTVPPSPPAAAGTSTSAPAIAAGTSTGAPATSTAAPATAAPSTGGAPAPEADPGGAGDEEPIRTPADFTVSGSAVSPSSVTVPPYLAVALTVKATDGAPHHVKLVGAGVDFDLPATGTASRTLPGLKQGMYALLVDGGKAAGSLVVGDQAAP